MIGCCAASSCLAASPQWVKRRWPLAGHVRLSSHRYSLLMREAGRSVRLSLEEFDGRLEADLPPGAGLQAGTALTQRARGPVWMPTLPAPVRNVSVNRSSMRSRRSRTAETAFARLSLARNSTSCPCEITSRISSSCPWIVFTSCSRAAKRCSILHLFSRFSVIANIIPYSTDVFTC
jgi:hypothetical protein